MIPHKRILITDIDARETIDMNTERIVNWMGQASTEAFDKAFAAWDSIDVAVEAGNIEELERTLRTLDNDVRILGVPELATCRCGYSWTPRTPSPKACPRCKRRLD